MSHTHNLGTLGKPENTLKQTAGRKKRCIGWSKKNPIFKQMIHHFYMMAILFSYVAHICTCCTMASMNFGSPGCLTLHFKNSDSALIVFFSLVTSMTSNHAAHHKKEKKCNKSFFLLIRYFSFTVCFCLTL